MGRELPRRRLLAGAAVGVGTLAGCVERPPRRASRAILVTNATEESFTVTLRVYDLPSITPSPTEHSTAGPTATVAGTGTATERDPPTGALEELLVRRADLPPDDGVGVGGDAVPATDLRVRVMTTDGRSGTYDWARLDDRSTLDVRIGATAVGFTEID